MFISNIKWYLHVREMSWCITNYTHKYPAVNGQWTSETGLLNQKLLLVIHVAFKSLICHKEQDVYARKWLNATTVSPIYVELIEFGDKRSENMWLHRLRKTEQIGHELETEIVAAIFLPVAEDSTKYSIELYSSIKIFVAVRNTTLNPHVFSMVESRVLQIKK